MFKNSLLCAKGNFARLKRILAQSLLEKGNLMNTELSKDVALPDATDRTSALKKKKRNNKKTPKPSVVYDPEELALVEGIPFWNEVHDAKIKSIEEEGIKTLIQQNGGEIEVFVLNEELLKKGSYNVDETIRIYLEDAIKRNGETEYPFVGSEIKALDLDLLRKAKEKKEALEIVKGYVVSEIKGGYAVALFAESREDAERGFGLRAFLPLGRTGLRRNEGLTDQDDRVVLVQITELDAKKGNVVVSRREQLVLERQKEEAAFFDSHKVGDQISGRVSAVMPYGAFINLGAVDGFLHISDVSWDKKPRLKDLIFIGKTITAKIIEVDRENKKVKLSIKDLNPDPWQTIEKTFKAGTEVEGDVVAFADFGAFVRLKDGVEGLIHLGEITWNRIKHPSQHFKIGDHIKALVLRVDKEAKRISLSTKALELSPVERLAGQFPIGAVIKTKIASIHDFGLFVEMDEISNGLVPRSEISWIRSDEPLENLFNVGQEIEVAVLGYDQKRQRVTCSIKRTTKDPWPQWKKDFRKGSIHKVKVLAVKRAGLVCELAEGLTGFCPKNQLAESDSDTGRVNVKVGDEIEVYITALDLVKQRITVSQKAAIESETKKAYESYLSEQGRSGARTTLGDAIKKRGQ